MFREVVSAWTDTPAVVVTFGDADQIPAIALIDTRSQEIIPVALSEDSFLVSEDARSITAQLARKVYRTRSRPHLAAALAFESADHNGTTRIRLVLALMLDGSVPEVQVDTDWYTLPKYAAPEDVEGVDLVALWTESRGWSRRTPTQRIQILVSRAYRLLRAADATTSHTHATAYAYEG